MAAKPADPSGRGDPVGGTFLAWGRFWPEGALPDPYGSYGTNLWGLWYRWWREEERHRYFWRTTDVKCAYNIPIQLDSCWPWSWMHDSARPPEYDAVPTARGRSWTESSCISRHDGFVNGLFMDWSVRRIGLKELWTLKWHREFNTAGPWTRAGRVKPEDWPQWMRRFKDH
jgi:prepilin-type processing-associated H-X9-DG protein